MAQALAFGQAVENVEWLEGMFHYLTSGDQDIPLPPAIRIPLTQRFRFTRAALWYVCRNGRVDAFAVEEDALGIVRSC